MRGDGLQSYCNDVRTLGSADGMALWASPPHLMQGQGSRPESGARATDTAQSGVPLTDDTVNR